MSVLTYSLAQMSDVGRLEMQAERILQIHAARVIHLRRLFPGSIACGKPIHEMDMSMILQMLKLSSRRCLRHLDFSAVREMIIAVTYRRFMRVDSTPSSKSCDAAIDTGLYMVSIAKLYYRYMRVHCVTLETIQENPSNDKD